MRVWSEPTAERLRCAACGKTTRAKNAEVLQGWYRGPDGARCCAYGRVVQEATAAIGTARSTGGRRKGIGRMLVTRALQALRAEGIDKCHLMVLPTNTGARRFWQQLGWVERTDVVLMSHTATGGEAPSIDSTHRGGARSRPVAWRPP